MRSLFVVLHRILIVLICCLPLAASAARLSAPQLEQLVAPIALYPDPLLSQILMASTYPADVAAAAAWIQQHPELSGDAAVQAVQDQSWDPSVQSLMAVPDVLALMGSQPGWVDSLGQAVQAQPQELMAAVQRLRMHAEQAGYLNDSEAQNLVVEPDESLAIEPTDEEMIYLPYYDPDVVYGIWRYPAFPPFFFPPPWGHGINVRHHHDGIRFGNGIVVHHALWGGCDWHAHRLFVNVAHFNASNPQRTLAATADTLTWHRGSLPAAAPVSARLAPAPTGATAPAQPGRQRKATPSQPDATLGARHAWTSPLRPIIAPTQLARPTEPMPAPPNTTLSTRHASTSPLRPAIVPEQLSHPAIAPRARPTDTLGAQHAASPPTVRTWAPPPLPAARALPVAPRPSYPVPYRTPQGQGAAPVQRAPNTHFSRAATPAYVQAVPYRPSEPAPARAEPSLSGSRSFGHSGGYR
ncbi:DUF3300 domain-containing protein [Crenobacter sp. SG2303]|uniref:DUF3300 domain-containing protein n=1 Tax=Crenobacter oryzisoli TaxID=3056844 RepID=A0ABT7XUT0_9NEIS|nr:DUF3300 domain-containing protein [Crenobacter sp. SG2303]MDN0077485.1 DUF3300 domain-containing protein [Crenobacter sp. SG2303]